MNDKDFRQVTGQAAANRAGLRSSIAPVIRRYPQSVVAVALRDPSSGTSLDIEADRPFHAASTMKLPVLIDVFRRHALGSLSVDDSITIKNEFHSIADNSIFHIANDTDDALHDRIGSDMSIGDLARRMITLSSNLATNLLIERLGADSVQQTIAQLGAEKTKVLRGVEDLRAHRQGLNNITTARDLAALLLAMMDGRVTGQASDAGETVGQASDAKKATGQEANAKEVDARGIDEQMVDILLGQQYDDMIPAGLPDGVRAAHKSGWITGIHHDAAIVYPGNDPPYVLAILTEGIAERDRSAAVGAEIARLVHASVRPDESGARQTD